MAEGGIRFEDRDVAGTETAERRHRLRTRLITVMMIATAVLLGTGWVGLHYVDTDVDNADLADERVILSIAKSF